MQMQVQMDKYMYELALVLGAFEVLLDGVHFVQLRINS
jgi:hypothetical protein